MYWKTNFTLNFYQLNFIIITIISPHSSSVWADDNWWWTRQSYLILGIWNRLWLEILILYPQSKLTAVSPWQKCIKKMLVCRTVHSKIIIFFQHRALSQTVDFTETPWKAPHYWICESTKQIIRRQFWTFIVKRYWYRNGRQTKYFVLYQPIM